MDFTQFTFFLLFFIYPLNQRAKAGTYLYLFTPKLPIVISADHLSLFTTHFPLSSCPLFKIFPYSRWRSDCWTRLEIIYQYRNYLSYDFLELLVKVSSRVRVISFSWPYLMFMKRRITFPSNFRLARPCLECIWKSQIVPICVLFQGE